MKNPRIAHIIQMIVGAISFAAAFFVNQGFIFALLFLVGLCLFLFGFFMFVRKADEYQN
ncbi:hypothetical protein ACXM2N_04800 [Corynebacterium sp. ZY180755]